MTDETATQGDLLALFEQIAADREAGKLDDDQAEHILTVDERFELYDAENPAVYRALVWLTRKHIRVTGRRRVGINLLVGKIRYEVSMRTKSEDFRINNVYAPYYARLIEAREPDLVGVFEQRRSRADKWIAAHRPEGRAA